MCHKRSGFHTSRSQPAFESSTTARSRPLGSKRRLRTLETSRHQLPLTEAKAPFARIRSRLIAFGRSKSHRWNATYVSSINEPLMMVKDETTLERDVAKSIPHPRVGDRGVTDLSAGKPCGEERDDLVRGCVGAGNRYGTALGRPAELGSRVALRRGQKIQAGHLVEQIAALHRSEGLED